jgi:hypothetical protein
VSSSIVIGARLHLLIRPGDVYGESDSRRRAGARMTYVTFAA